MTNATIHTQGEIAGLEGHEVEELIGKNFCHSMQYDYDLQDIYIVFEKSGHAKPVIVGFVHADQCEGFDLVDVGGVNKNRIKRWDGACDGVMASR